MKRVSLVFTVFVLIFVGVLAHAQTYIFGRADIAVGNFPTSIAAGDFNGDGLIDFAVTNSADQTVSILLGKGGGIFAPQVTYTTGLEPTNVVAGDFSAQYAAPARLASSSGVATVRFSRTSISQLEHFRRP
jgi:hypothetical protein